MIDHKTNVRVRYAETDKMGYVYYGNYPQYFEIGRVEWLRSLYVSYKNMEDNGIMLPVTKLEIEYLKPAKYDDLLTIKTTLIKVPSARIEFTYEINNENDDLLTRGYTCLVFIDMLKNRPVKAPEYVLEKIKNLIQ